MANCVQEFATSICLAKVTYALAGHRLLKRPGVVKSRDEENRRSNALSDQCIPQINPGHAGQLYVEHEAIKLRLLNIRAERFCGCICDRLDPRRTQQSSDRAANALVIVDDAYTEIIQATDCHDDKPIWHEKLTLLPFGAAWPCRVRRMAALPLKGRLTAKQEMEPCQAIARF